MLRISVLCEPGITRMRLEGKLAHEWVTEARKTWAELLETGGDTEIVVDLLEVSFVDDAGHELLAEMRHADAELIAAGPLMSALIDDIEEAETAATQDVPDGD